MVRNASSIAAGRRSNSASSRTCRSSSIARKSPSMATGSVAIGKSRACRFCSRMTLTCRTDLRGAVVALHQLLARAPRRRVGEPELVRERALQVEHQAILAPAREIVEPHAQRADQPLLPRHGARLLQRDQPGAREVAPSAPETGGARDPQDRVQVAQPARAFLDVRLEVVGGVVVLEMPLLLLEHLGFVERRHVHRRGDAAAEGAMQRAAIRRRNGARAGSS